MFQFLLSTKTADEGALATIECNCSVEVDIKCGIRTSDATVGRKFVLKSIFEFTSLTQGVRSQSDMFLLHLGWVAMTHVSTGRHYPSVRALEDERQRRVLCLWG